ncbi:restriction endonuclease subunit S [Pseudonocardia lacus]|uniref:restriction endonuclease subunit S n=1 Tax=Pseudonocardia lacus TaxID=2835865 RepID=UPI001BDC7E81|nr:restriction endonuclease subunit S [Pseudonocardia lacus]
MPSIPAPDGFKWRRLTDIARMESGHTPSRSHPEYWNGNIPWIGIRDATGNHGKTITKTKQYITELGVENSSTRVLPAGTVCLSRTASVGYTIIMGTPMATSQDFINWVCGPELSPSYLRYVLMLEQESIRKFSYGTTHQTLYYPDAKALHVCIPSRDEQDEIARVLAALDDKIAANTRLSDAAEDLAAIVFRSIAKDDPTERSLSQLARFVNGRAYTKGATGTGRVVIRIAELNSGIGESTVRNDIKVPDENLARPGDLLFAWSGSLTVHRWFRPEGIVNQHIFKVIPTGDNPVWLVHQLLVRKLDEFRAIAADKATTMGHIQRRHLDEPVSVPARRAVERVHPTMDSLWRTALSAEQESLSLTTLRDTLLPHLMSGRLRVKDAEKQVEAVV